MIINVGGRTDIVNYYTPWLINRLNEGFVYTRNPYNPNQLTKYDLSPNKVDAIIFCSKNYKHILEYMPQLMNKYPIYCHYTITSYGKDVEPNVPSVDDSIETLKSLSEIVGSNRLAWRYDPILLTDRYTVETHLESFEYMTSILHDYISSCIFSFIDMYKKVYRNMPEIVELCDENRTELLEGLSGIAKKYDMPLQSCAVGNEYEDYGIRNSGCTTAKILEESNDIIFKKVKHTGCRDGCKCMPWRDIGEYDTCPNSCKYCYANKNPRVAKRNYKLHDPLSPVLIGHIKEDDVINHAKQKSFLLKDGRQQTLF